MSQLPKSAKDLFLAALDIEPAERAAFLDDACAGDAALQRQIEALLRVHDEPDSLLDSPRIDLGLSGDAGPNPGIPLDQPIAEAPGTMIGPYKLLELIGEGGMGVVYMAEQSEPVARRVALKIIKPGMDTRQVIGRFEAERQALAMMDHPNIATVHDAGTTESGRPYFVMELVGGTPITQYADEHHLTPQQRLELFVPVCQAIQHAHQKGIIHRDIKPSNVLIAEYDGRPVPKVIDFGVAKAIEKGLAEKTMFTHYGQIVGTIDYMSPEQANLNQHDVDTRSDVYSLGVLLYELLTGETPFDRQRLRSAAFDELLRIIREEDPPKPSLRLSTSDSLPSIAVNRQLEPKKLGKLVSGELDWVVMKALEKDRIRRYEAANDLAKDVTRYLNDEPVEACPPSKVYRLRKFARRNKTAVIASTAVALALIVGAAIATDQAVRATEAERLAEENLKKARQAVDRLFTKVASDLRDVPHMEHIRRALLEDALEFYQGFLDQKGDDRDIRHETALTYQRVGRIHIELGNSSEARKALKQSVNGFEELSGDYPSDAKHRLGLSESLGSLAYTFIWATQTEGNVKWRRRNLDVLEELVTDFPTVRRYRSMLATSHTDLGNALFVNSARRDEAEKHFRLALEVWQKRRADFPQLAEDLRGLCHTHQWLGAFLLGTNQLMEAEEELHQAFAFRKQFLAKNPNSPGERGEMAHLTAYMGLLYVSLGKPSEAEKHFREAIAIREKLLNEFPDTFEHRRRLGVVYRHLGTLLRDTGRSREAEDAFRRRQAIQEKLVSDFPERAGQRCDLGWASYDLGLLLQQTGRTQEAAEAFQRAGRLFEKLTSEYPENHRFQKALVDLLTYCPASQFRDAGRAVELAKRALQYVPQSMRWWEVLGTAQYQTSDFKAAIESIEKAMKLCSGGNGEQWLILSMAQWQLDKKEEARRWYDKAVEWMDEHQPKGEELRRFRAEWMDDHQPKSEELRRFRAEAAELLMIDE